MSAQGAVGVVAGQRAADVVAGQQAAGVVACQRAAGMVAGQRAWIPFHPPALVAILLWVFHRLCFSHWV